MHVDGKRVLITGGGSGIGRATATKLAAGGARLAIADRDEAGARETAAVLHQGGGEAEAFGVDISREEDCARLAATLAQRWQALDTVICCAGILRGAYVPVAELDLATFDDVVGVNLRGAFLTVKHMVPLLRQGRNPLVILLASGAGVAGGSSSVAYGSSKGGVHGLSLVLERQLSREGIRVLDVCPGSVNTPMKRTNIGDEARSRGADGAAAEAAAATYLTDPALLGNLLCFLTSDDGAAVRGTIFTK